ncbi:hypothetical protein D3C71_1691890 [compost metagenome]
MFVVEELHTLSDQALIFRPCRPPRLSLVVRGDPFRIRNSLQQPSAAVPRIVTVIRPFRKEHLRHLRNKRERQLLVTSQRNRSHNRPIKRAGINGIHMDVFEKLHNLLCLPLADCGEEAIGSSALPNVHCGLAMSNDI